MQNQLSAYDDDDRHLINSCYGGSAEKYEAAKKQSRSKTISWSDIETYAKVHPQFSQCAEDEILKRLGYLPHPNITIPHEVFMRAVIESFVNGQSSIEDYELDINRHVRDIRNDDMKKFGWADKTGYDNADLERYRTHLPQFKAAAQKRIALYFGYQPALGYALHAELIIRELCAAPNYFEEMAFIEHDYKAFTIIAYRQVFEEAGEAAAGLMPLLASW